MRIAIDETMSSGKTTLFTQLQRDLSAERFDFVPEASRAVAAEFSVESVNDWDELLAEPSRLNAFFAREEDWLTAHESEHCIVDSSFYMIQTYKRVFANFPIIEKPIWPTYDLVLFCEPLENGQEDGFRFLHRRIEIGEVYLRHRERFRVSKFCDLAPSADRAIIASRIIEKLVEQ